MNKYYVLAITFIFLVTVLSAQESSPRGFIEYCLDNDCKRLPGVRVTLLKQKCNPATTNDEGEYVLYPVEYLTEGSDYTIEFYKEGYERLEKTLRLGNNGDFEKVQLKKVEHPQLYINVSDIKSGDYIEGARISINILLETSDGNKKERSTDIDGQANVPFTREIVDKNPLINIRVQMEGYKNYEIEQHYREIPYQKLDVEMEKYPIKTQIFHPLPKNNLDNVANKYEIEDKDYIQKYEKIKGAIQLNKNPYSEKLDINRDVDLFIGMIDSLQTIMRYYYSNVFLNGYKAKEINCDSLEVYIKKSASILKGCNLIKSEIKEMLSILKIDTYISENETYLNSMHNYLTLKCNE